MDRLTTDNPQGCSETQLNLAYVQEDWVCIRGLDEPFMHYIKKKCSERGCNLSEMNDYELCETVTDCAFSNPTCPFFLLFQVATQAAELRARLMLYEDTRLEPEEIPTSLELANVFAALEKLKQYEAIGTVERFGELQKQFDGVNDFLESQAAKLLEKNSKLQKALCALCRDVAKRDGNLLGCYSCHFRPTSIAGGNTNG